MNKRRNFYLDFWKGIACFGVVFFHTYYAFYWGDRDVGNMLKAFFRFAIPLFFMISGYYCYYADNAQTAKKLPNKIKHIFQINVVASVAWLFLQLVVGLFGDTHGGLSGMRDMLGAIFTPKKLIVWLLFNEDPFVKILWFLSALLYMYLAMMLINRFNLYKASYVGAIICLVIHYFLGNVCKGFGIEINSIYYRNFLLMAFPFFMFGHYIHRNEKELLHKFTLKVCIFMFVLGELLTIPEWYFLDKTEISIGAVLAAFAIFVLSLHVAERKAKSIITYIGTELSLFIYIIHMAVKLVMDKVAEKLFYSFPIVDLAYQVLKPLLCFGISVVAGILFYKVMNYLKGMRKKANAE